MSEETKIEAAETPVVAGNDETPVQAAATEAPATEAACGFSESASIAFIRSRFCSAKRRFTRTSDQHTATIGNAHISAVITNTPNSQPFNMSVAIEETPLGSWRRLTLVVPRPVAF
mgnify:CR=1 FL=1